jgi:hypothetical protein
MKERYMSKFDVRVNGKDAMYCESFILFARTKLEAMKKGIRLARLCDNVAGEIHATAKVVR